MEQVMLDMIPTGAKAVCHVSQYDIGRTIRFNLISGGAAYTLAGTETVKVYIKKPDGTTAERNIANTSSTYVDWVTGEGDCDQAGNCECELVITSGTTVIGSKNFTVKIEEDPYNEQGVVTETAGPAVIATFTTNVVDLLQEVKCSINPIQNGTPWIDSNEINKEPYIKRAVAGTATRIGNHLYDKLVGGTVAFNQLIQNGNFESTSGWNNGYHAQNFSVSNNEGSFEATGQYAQITGNLIKVVANHIFLCHGFAKCTNNRKLAIGTTSIGYTYIDITNVYSELNTLKKASASNSESVIITSSNSDVGDVFSIKKINIIDLTQKFGSTIADYIYSLEQATAGAGVAWLKDLGFIKDYFPYNAGELMSVKATAHIMRDASNTVIGNYPLDSNLELRGIPKLVNNKLEYDGDTYESNGDVTRRYGIVDLGSLSYFLASGASSPSGKLFRTSTALAKPRERYSENNVICRLYTSKPSYWFISNVENMGVMVDDSGYVYIRNDTYDNDIDAFKTAMNGVYLIYELATPTTEQASPFTNPQVCDENGTEEYTDSRAVAIPVGHETYQANICEITGFDELNIKQSGQDMSEIAKLIKLEFDDTVYLAEVSCLNGVWKLKLLGAEVDLGDLTYTRWTDDSAYYIFYAPLTNKENTKDNTGLCSYFPLLSANATSASNAKGRLSTNNTACLSKSTMTPCIYLRADQYTTTEALVEALSGQKLVYELATPIEITLDETEQFEALLGVNNVWHDGNGNTEVKYLYNA